MASKQDVESFLAAYSQDVQSKAFEVRKVILKNLPEIIEQIDLPARMIAYTYGQKYTELICTLIPSKKGLKLGFNRGTEITDPEKMLEGSGKFSRYVEIKSSEQILSPALKALLISALVAYQQRIATK